MWCPAVRRSQHWPSAVLLALAVLAFGRVASAATFEAPSGGAAFALPQDRVVCGTAPEGWAVDVARRRVRAEPGAHPGKSASVIVAPSIAACTGSKETATLVVVGPRPSVDPGSVTIFADKGRLELSGQGLDKARVSWTAGAKTGSDVCVSVGRDKGHDLCAIAMDAPVPADPLRIVVSVAPAGARPGTDVVLYDDNGNMVPEDELRVPVSRVLVDRVLPLAASIDVSRGEGQFALPHPEALASADCAPARCEMTSTGIAVRGVPAAYNALTVRTRLSPRVFLMRGDATESTSSETVPVLRCPLAIVSGEPPRDVDDLSVLARLDKSCGKDLDHIRWTASGETAEVRRMETLEDGVYVLLWIGRISAEKLNLVASRVEDGSVLAVTSERTWSIPPLHTSLDLVGFGEVEFIPKNREAILSVSKSLRAGTIVPISVPGAYTVTWKKSVAYVRGEHTSGGYTALRFEYHPLSVPSAFKDVGFATLVDPVQRPIRDANVPAPLGASSVTARPIVELVCSVGHGKTLSIPSGSSRHIPYSERDSCRLVIHRNRIPPDSGEQRLDIDISVATVSGERTEGRQAIHLVVRYSPETDVIWIRGAKEQFDRLGIRVTHVVDESQYLSRTPGKLDLPSAQWTVVTEDASFRFYATATIPASLYRFSSDPQDLGTGPLSLNFGVLSRLTWLDDQGHEGLVGLEAGVMAMGLATDKERQLAPVAGLGVAIPLGNANQPTQAAVNIHAWVAYSIGHREGQLRDAAGNVTGTVRLNPWAFVFGPSITIGNIGTFL